MDHQKWSIPRRVLWTYGYRFVPPIARDRMGPTEALLEAGGEKARLSAFAWEGLTISRGTDCTLILVVSDSSEQGREVHERLEDELNRLGAQFTITRALAVGVDPRSGHLPPPMGHA